MTYSDNILKLANSYYEHCVAHITKFAVIKKLPNGKYRVLSENGRNLGTYKKKDVAEKRLKQVEYFKYLDSLKDKSKVDDKEIDLSGMDEFSFSCLIRELNKKASKEQLTFFLKIHKAYFDKAVKDKIKNPEKISLKMAFTKFSKLHKVKVNSKIIKTAAVTELGDPKLVGKYLADIVRFTLKRISPAKRQGSINNLKNKFYYLNENEIASKKMPASSSIGQAITFVKTVLFNQNAKYIRDVLNHLIRFL